MLLVTMALLGGLLVFPSPARAQETAVATSFLVDPSPRSSAMGGASAAVFWDDPSPWSNPALLGLGLGIRYRWSEADLSSAVPSRSTHRARNLTVEYGGLGLDVRGTPALLRGPALDGDLLIGFDEDLNLLGYFSYAESVSSVAGGVALLRTAETLARLSRWFGVPALSRYGDFSVGWSSKSIRSGYMPRRVTLHDLGGLVRITPYDAIDRSGLWPSLDRRVSLRLDVAHGRSSQNQGRGTLFSWSSVRVEPIPELARRGWAGRVTAALPAASQQILRQGRFSWILDFVEPSASLGASWDRIESTRYDRSTATTTVGPVIHRSGWEASLGNTFAYRWGRIDDPDAGVTGSTSGFSVRLAYRGLCGLQYEWARVPREPNRSPSRHEGLVAHLDPLALWRGLR